MTDDKPRSSLTDPAGISLQIVEDEGDEEPGMTEAEAEEFLARPVEPMQPEADT